jgi:hypothetical protein
VKRGYKGIKAGKWGRLIEASASTVIHKTTGDLIIHVRIESLNRTAKVFLKGYDAEKYARVSGSR